MLLYHPILQVFGTVRYQELNTQASLGPVEATFLPTFLDESHKFFWGLNLLTPFIADSQVGYALHAFSLLYHNLPAAAFDLTDEIRRLTELT